jgi:peptidoglycan/xylan/chitin deacetylase (PgdA/CDA1 family)
VRGAAYSIGIALGKLLHPLSHLSSKSSYETDLIVRNHSVPILMYHQITPAPSSAFRKYAITPGVFEQHLVMLAALAFTPITLDMLMDCREGRQSFPKRPVVITFDDGFQDCFHYAAPILKRHQFTATFFLVAGLMGGSSRWLVEERGVEFPMMDWAMARQLEAAGFQCEAHSMTHPHLADLCDDSAHQELCESRDLLEQHLGHPVVHLAYPFGSYDERVRAIAQEVGYRSACTVRTGLSSAADPPLELRRVPISGQDSVPDFLCRVRTGYTLYESYQHTARCVRLRLDAVCARAAMTLRRPWA